MGNDFAGTYAPHCRVRAHANLQQTGPVFLPGGCAPRCADEIRSVSLQPIRMGSIYGTLRTHATQSFIPVSSASGNGTAHSCPGQRAASRVWRIIFRYDVRQSVETIGATRAGRVEAGRLDFLCELFHEAIADGGGLR